MNFKIHRRTPLLFVLICFMCLGGCQRYSQEKGDIVGELDDLYKVYLTGSANEAKESMYKAIELLESCQGGITEQGKMHGLGMAYSRLFCIALVENDQEGARSSFAKAKAFFEKKLEIMNASNNKEIMNISDEERKEQLDKLTEDILFRQLSEKDLRCTGGRGPKYAENKNINQ